MYKSILILLIFGSFYTAMYSQSTDTQIQCDLMNMYSITAENSPALQRQYLQIETAESNLIFSDAAFDPILFSDVTMSRNRSTLLEFDPLTEQIGSNLKSRNLDFLGGAQKRYRSGLSTTASIGYNRTSNNIPLNSFNENVGPYFNDNTTTVNLSVIQPLLRGRGKAITTANQRMSELSIDNQKLILDYTYSIEVFNMTVNYWQYLAEHQSLEIYNKNEDRVKQVLEITQELVNAEKKPRSELLQIKADIRTKERQTVLAEQQLHNARQNLGRQIGYDENMSNQLGIPLDDFPELILEDVNINPEDLIQIAIQNRADLKSQWKSSDLTDIGVEIAKDGLKPKLDLTGFVNYSGKDAGNNIDKLISPLFQSPGRNINSGISFNFSLPVRNRQAEANYINRKLIREDQQIIIDNQIRIIESNVNIAYNNLMGSISSLEKAKETYSFSKTVFENEEIKFKNGLTTLLNLILLQERLTFAQLDLIQSKLSLAISLATLRHETGTLVSSTNNITPSLDIFYSLPTFKSLSEMSENSTESYKLLVNHNKQVEQPSETKPVALSNIDQIKFNTKEGSEVKSPTSTKTTVSKNIIASIIRSQNVMEKSAPRSNSRLEQIEKNLKEQLKENKITQSQFDAKIYRIREHERNTINSQQ